MRDFYDRLKKYAVEGIGIFMVISFSFYVENKGGEYEMTKSYLEMLHAFKKDILETTALKNKYDVMVSNPPYVRQLEKKAMKANVLDYEPGLALFVPNEDPLLFYRKIAQLAMVSLQTRGWLYFEINEYLSKEMDVLLKDIGFANIEIKKDFREVPRMIKCQKL